MKKHHAFLLYMIFHSSSCTCVLQAWWTPQDTHIDPSSVLIIRWFFLCLSLSARLLTHLGVTVYVSLSEHVFQREKVDRCVCAVYWKASRNMSTTLMIISNIMMTNTTTFWVSGGRLQRRRVLKNPIFCLFHRPEPLPRAISPLVSSSSSSSAPVPCRLSLSTEPPHHTASACPTPWLPLSSSKTDSHLRSAPTVTSPASPATLPMLSVAPACRWRLCAYLYLCVNPQSYLCVFSTIRSFNDSFFF